MGVDQVGGSLFFAKTLFRERGIWKSALDGSSPQLIAAVPKEQNNIRDLVVDSSAQKVYWVTDIVGKKARIRRCNFDGSKVEELHALEYKGTSIQALALGFAPDATWLERISAKLRAGCL